jgi:hypothetical protein
VFTADLDLARLAAAEARAAEAGADDEVVGRTGAAPGQAGSGAGRAAFNGQVDGTALDDQPGGAGAGEGGSGP